MRLQESLYTELVPTLGPRILPTLLRRLRALAEGPDVILLDHVVRGVASFSEDLLAPYVLELLARSEPLVQRAAMKLLTQRPVSDALDRLWQVHCVLDADRRRFCREHEQPAEAYSDSFSALLACVRRSPAWLESAINAADATRQPVHDLAHLLSNLDHGGELWQRCKDALFSKVQPGKERCLAKCIYRFIDTREVERLRSWVDRQDNRIGPWALRALNRIDADLAVMELPRLPPVLLGPTKRWCFTELRRRRPEPVRAYILDLLRRPGVPVQVLMVYQDDQHGIDAATLAAMLELFERVVERELEGDSADSTPPFFILCSLIAGLGRADQLRVLAAHRGSPLEEKLTTWLLRRGPLPTEWARPDQDLALAVLEKLEGTGYTRVINQYLGAPGRVARWEAIEAAVRHPDDETIAHLARLSEGSELFEGHPIEQGLAMQSLAALRQWAPFIAAVVRWGLAIPRDVTRRMTPEGVDRGALEPAMAALTAGDERLPGAVLALGIGGPRDAAESIRAILRDAPLESEVAHACIIALRLLRDRSDDAVTLVARHLIDPVPAIRHDAIVALSRIRTSAAEQSLVQHLGTSFDPGVAVQLLQRPSAGPEVAPLVRRYLETLCGAEKVEAISGIVLALSDNRLLASIIADASAREILGEAVGPPEGIVLDDKIRIAAIGALARFDADAAFEAARHSLQSRATARRELYPAILVEIAPLAAIPLLLEYLRGETVHAFRRATARAFTRLDAIGAHRITEHLRRWLRDTDAKRRQVACDVLGWICHRGDSRLHLMRGLHDDVSEKVVTAASEAMTHVEDTEQTWEILRLLHNESDASRQWLLLDALLVFADPGDPEWLRQALAFLPAPMGSYLDKKVSFRRQEVSREAERNTSA